MTALKTSLRALCAAAALAMVASASAAPVAWADWTSFGGSTAGGSMGGIGVSVSSVSAMDGLTQLGGPGAGCENYWSQPNAADPAYTGGSVSNAPTACEQLGLSTANTVTVTFSSAVSTLYMALLSVGQPGYEVSYSFNRAFTIDSEGAGYWGNDSTDGVQIGNTLAMNEFHGVLRFNAPVTTVTFSTAPGEYWHAFTFGSAVPEPASLALVGAALLAAGVATRRRKA